MFIYNILPLLICANGPVVVHINVRTLAGESTDTATLMCPYQVIASKLFAFAWHDVDIIFAGDGTFIWQLLCLNIRGLGYRRFSLQATWAFWILVTRRIAHLTPEVVPAPLHTLAATGLEMTCHKVRGNEYKCRYRLEARKNRRSQTKNWWGIKGRF